MSSRSEAYLAELDRRLARRVAEPRRGELIAELRSHLHLHANDTGSESEALQPLGPVELVAEDLIRSESGLDVRSPWRLAALPLVLLVLSSTIPLFMAWVLHFESLPYTTVQIGSEYVILAAFAWCVWRSRRWLLLPVIVALLLIDGIGLVSMATTGPVLHDRQAMDGKVEALRVYRTWPPPANTAVEVGETADRHRYYVPGRRSLTFPRRLPYGFGVHWNLKVHEYDTVLGAQEARRRWKSEGGAFMDRVLLQLLLIVTSTFCWKLSVFALLNGCLLKFHAIRRHLIHRRKVLPKVS
ncbi:MAG: hypothetical protein M9921_10275 [Fimbriimonadaceae bacterium]|nr:hypothetical protein [Chthonomonadaceae bacterium]MCO5297231.1 hypothetical protein [Fimbriimonadaceae bacterium]